VPNIGVLFLLLLLVRWLFKLELLAIEIELASFLRLAEFNYYPVSLFTVIVLCCNGVTAYFPKTRLLLDRVDKLVGVMAEVMLFPLVTLPLFA